MQASTKCTLRTALILAALLIPGGCLALLAVTLLRRCYTSASEKAQPDATPVAGSAANA